MDENAYSEGYEAGIRAGIVSGRLAAHDAIMKINQEGLSPTVCAFIELAAARALGPAPAAPGKDGR